MPESDLDLIVDAARSAGEIAKRFFEGPNKVWEKGPDDPVTEADHAVDAYLKEQLCAARPGYGWLSEETPDDTKRLDCARVFVVDPIDGTRSFVAGEPTWAHSIAVVENGVPVAGAVYLPMKDRLYAAALGAGATLNDTQITHSGRMELEGATLLASRPVLNSANWTEVPPVERVFRSSLAYRLSLVGEGRFDAMVTLRNTWEWDIAAGALIAAEAGATVTDRHNAPLQFNTPKPMSPGILVAAPILHEKLAGRLAEPTRNGP